MRESTRVLDDPGICLTSGWLERPYYDEMGDGSRDEAPGNEVALCIRCSPNGKDPH